MSGVELAFWVLGAVAVGSSVLVVTGRNPVASLLFLVVSFFALAGLFVTLEAHFLAAIQILVYAGAILVLFLFVIMLLNLGSPEEAAVRLRRGPAAALAVLGAVGFALILFLVVGPLDTPAAAGPDGVTGAPAAGGAAGTAAADAAGRAAGPGVAESGIAADPSAGGRDPGAAGGAAAGTGPAVGTTAALGSALFREYLLPFEVTSLLLLAAMVGAVMLAKRQR
jgi:NADH-quinone oxidoreductase subunit J